MKNSLIILKLIFASVLLTSCEAAKVNYLEPEQTVNTAQSSSCTVTRLNASEVEISCPDGTREVVRDGQNGLNGENGQDVEVIDPCGQQSATGFDEVLLRLPSGKIVVYLKLGNYEFLSVLKSNVEYVTTDDTQCHFKIGDDGKVYDSVGSVL